MSTLTMQALDGADEDGGTLYVLRDQEGGFISLLARTRGAEVEWLPSEMGGAARAAPCFRLRCWRSC